MTAVTGLEPKSQRACRETTVWAEAVQDRTYVDAAGRTMPRPSYVERFFRNIREDDNGCWLWTKTPATKGYASFWIARSIHVQAHRWAYELLVAEIPDGLQLDHLCRVRHCVNPWHMDPVDNRENQRRGEHPTAGIAFRTNTCPQGHSLADAYVSTNRRTGKRTRRCRPCQQTSYAEYIARKRAVA